MMVIRPARLGDLPAVRTLTVEVYRPLLPEGDPYLRVLGEVGKRFARAEIVVAELGGAIVGSLTMAEAGSRYADVARPGELEFRMLAVSPAARGRGVGTALVEHVLAEAQARRRAGVVLTTHPAMAEARRIYNRLGFVRAPERDWEPVPGAQLTVMVRSLAAPRPAA
jgi:ribosomal protein S18 acetylase RimI-like enzyme